MNWCLFENLYSGHHEYSYKKSKMQISSAEIKRDVKCRFYRYHVVHHAWPPRSPDLTPTDLFFWGFVNDLVYRTPVRDIRDLKQRIQEAIAQVTPAILENVWENLEQRLRAVIENKGGHIENVL